MGIRCSAMIETVTKMATTEETVKRVREEQARREAIQKLIELVQIQNDLERKQLQKDLPTVKKALEEKKLHGRRLAWKWVEKAIRLRIDYDPVFFSDLFDQYANMPTYDVETKGCSGVKYGLNLSQLQIMLRDIERAIISNCFETLQFLRSNRVQKLVHKEVLEETKKKLNRNIQDHEENWNDLELTAIQEQTLKTFAKFDRDGDGFISSGVFVQCVEKVCFGVQLAVVADFMFGRLGA